MGREPVPELTRLEHILISAIAAKERYGLEIIARVEEATGRAPSLGGLYTTLGRMEKKGLVESRWGETVEGRQGARRKYYKATGLGVRALTTDRQILQKAWQLVPLRARLLLTEV
jgi:DNA-binding PadR family transcriptional regulator